MKEKRSEVDLAKAVVNWLAEQGWEVWQEVQLNTYSNIHDIVAVKCGLTWTIECKMTMNLTVIAQAERSSTCFRSIAIPHASSSSSTSGHALGERICKDKGIGIITVSYGYESIRVGNAYSPSMFKAGYKYRKELIERLQSIPKAYAEAGSKQGHWTPYRETMDSVKRFVAKNPGCSIKDIMKSVDHHYRSDATAKSCIPKCLRDFEKWVKIENGKYYINESVVA